MALKSSAAAGPGKERHVAAETDASPAGEAAPEASPEMDVPSAEFASLRSRLPSPRPSDASATPISVARVMPRATAPSNAARSPVEMSADPGLARVQPPPRPASRFLLLALTFVAGVAAGGVGLYLLHADLPLGLDRFEPRRALAPAAKAAHELGIGVDATTTPRANAGHADISALTAMFERQLAAGKLDRPDIDNALETYRQIAAVAPQDPATTRIGEHLAAAFWTRANEARAAKRWDDALHDFAQLKALPPIPWQMLAAKLDGTPANAAPDGSAGAASPPPSPATSSAASAAPSDAAPAMASTGSDAAAVFMARGDDALQQGDVISARQFYELAAASGLARAATAVGRTYDPDFLQARGVRGAFADMAQARRWYHKGIDGGDAEARLRLDRLMTPSR
jgi:TPR repeat protein